MPNRQFVQVWHGGEQERGWATNEGWESFLIAYRFWDPLIPLGQLETLPSVAIAPSRLDFLAGRANGMTSARRTNEAVLCRRKEERMDGYTQSSISVLYPIHALALFPFHVNIFLARQPDDYYLSGGLATKNESTTGYVCTRIVVIASEPASEHT